MSSSTRPPPQSVNEGRMAKVLPGLVRRSARADKEGRAIPPASMYEGRPVPPGSADDLGLVCPAELGLDEASWGSLVWGAEPGKRQKV